MENFRSFGNPGLREILPNAKGSLTVGNIFKRCNHDQSHYTEKGRRCTRSGVTYYGRDKCPVKIAQTSRRYCNFLTLYEGELATRTARIMSSVIYDITRRKCRRERKRERKSSVFHLYNYVCAPFFFYFSLCLSLFVFSFRLIFCIRDFGLTKICGVMHPLQFPLKRNARFL